MAIQKSNYTQIPNDILALMPKMEDTELRVTLAICRSTFGWQKVRDRVSLTQLVETTGLSRQGVITGIATAVRRGTINKYETPSGNEYEVNVLDQPEPASLMNGLPLVQPVDQKSGLLVQPVDTQKKVLKKTKETNSAHAPKIPKPAKKVVDPRSAHPAIIAFRDVTSRYPAVELYDEVIRVCGESPNVDRMRSCWMDWIKVSSNRANMTWMLDWYARGCNGNPGTKTPKTISTQTEPALVAMSDGTLAKPYNPWS